MMRGIAGSNAVRQLLLGIGAFGVVAGVLVATAHAAEPAPPDGNGRFTMQQTPDGVLRLDTQSGAVSLCKPRAGAWACDAVADDRRATDDELKRLRDENAALKGDIKRLEEIAGLGSVPDPDKPGTKGKGGIQMPSEEDLDKAMTYMQRMLKKFKDKLKELESEMGSQGEPKKGTNL